MRIVDEVILAELRAALPPVMVNGQSEERVHDGLVPLADPHARVVTAVLPYLAYFSSIGDDHSDDEGKRIHGRPTRRSVFFQVTYVGVDRNQAKWAGEKARARIGGKRFVFTGRNSWLVKLEESQRVRRDDDAARPDGSPLFYGVDLYSVSVTLSPTE